MFLYLDKIRIKSGSKDMDRPILLVLHIFNADRRRIAVVFKKVRRDHVEKGCNSPVILA